MSLEIIVVVVKIEKKYYKSTKTINWWCLSILGLYNQTKPNQLI